MKGKEYLSSISLSYCVFLQCNQTISISHDHNVLTLQRFGTKFADSSKEDPTNKNSASVRIISLSLSTHSSPYVELECLYSHLILYYDLLAISL